MSALIGSVVSLGGGHGQAAVLRALRLLSDDLTAVVTVADDGGSSGRLVRELGIPPPGDARRTLLALANSSELGDVFNYRFDRGQLKGHSLGNLVLAGLAGIEGDFAAALARAGDLLDAVGTVVPAATEPVRLIADVDGRRVEGQDVIKHRTGIRTVALDPPDPPAPEAATAAIARADLIVIGPGSLFTSILPVLCVPGIRAAVAGARARRVYVCNLTVEPGETEGMDARAHLDAFVANAGKDVADMMLVNSAPVAVGQALEVPDADEIGGVAIRGAPLAADRGAIHDARRLADALMTIVAD